MASYSATFGDGKVTWQVALDFVKGMNEGTYPDCAAGKTDWRLPNRRELHSLTDHGTTTGDTIQPGHPFDNVTIGSAPGYWSSTTYASLKSWAWYWNPKIGDVSGTPKSGQRHVWPVRRAVAAIPDPNIAVSPTSLDFGVVTQSATSEMKTMTISNTGGAELDVLCMTESGHVIFPVTTDGQETACGSTSPNLAAGKSCTIRVQFKPNATATFNETIKIGSNDPDAPEVVVNLTCQGTDYPEGSSRCGVNPTSHEFGEVPLNQRSEAHLFTIGNTGDVAMTVSRCNDQQATDFQTDLTAGDRPCGDFPITVAVNDHCSFAIVFAPKAVGDRGGWIHVHSDDPIHPSIQLTLTGFGGPDQSEGGCGCTLDRSANQAVPMIILILVATLLAVRRRTKWRPLR